MMWSILKEEISTQYHSRNKISRSRQLPWKYNNKSQKTNNNNKLINIIPEN